MPEGSKLDIVQAWQLAAEKFAKPSVYHLSINFGKTYICVEVDTSEEQERQVIGLCCFFDVLLDLGRISLETWFKIKSDIKEEANGRDTGRYLWPHTLEGFMARSQFALRMVEKHTRKREENGHNSGANEMGTGASKE